MKFQQLISAPVRRAIAVITVSVAATGAAQSVEMVLNAQEYTSAPTVPFQGKVFKIVKGTAYEVRGNQLYYVDQIYDPDFHIKSYRVEGGAVYRLVENQKYPVKMSITEDFENATTIRDLIGPTKRWTSLTVQGPKTPTVTDYVALRRRLLAGTSDFLDNRVEPSSAVVHSGSKSLRAYALPVGGSLDVSKASLECELLYLHKGDHFWFSGWFNITKGSPTGILDLESGYLRDYPGLRILLSETLQPRVELKFANKPTYVANSSVKLPRNQWVQIRMHAYLTDGPDGRVELWVDGQQVISASGQTLPLPDTIYDRLEVGISANTTGSVAEVFVDDLKFDTQPIQ